MIEFRQECAAFADYIRHHRITKEKRDHVVQLEDVLGHTLAELIHKYHAHKRDRILIVSISTILFGLLGGALAWELTKPKPQMHAKEMRGPIKAYIAERYIHFAVGDTVYFTTGHNQPIFIMHDTHFAHAVKVVEIETQN